MTRPKIIVVLGPTASGKSALAVELAKKFDGEVVSADSRQVYKGLNIGTGKISKKEMGGIPHHLLDVVSPKRRYTVARFKAQAEEAVESILSRGKLPILCGGTGFYIQSVVDGVSPPEVEPNPTLRKKLSTKSTEELLTMLTTLDPRRAHAVDPRNKVRLIRSIEIAKALGKVPGIASNPLYDALQIGISTDDETLKNNIKKRLTSRIESGMFKEMKTLHNNGLSWKRMFELGLEYRYGALHLSGKMSREETIKKLETKIWHYARRQKAWFRRDRRVKWFSINEIERIEREIKRFCGR